jgi:hypothetical protein
LRTGKLRYLAAVATAFAVAGVPFARANDKPDRTPATLNAPTPNSPLILVVSLKGQRVRVYDVTGEIASSRISSGRPGFATPTGVFSILEKNVHHRSNIYSGARMPYMERITWSGIALHAGVVPGFRASHGCIRLPYNFSRQLYGLTKIGDRVIVTPDDVRPIAFSSPKLFKPLPLDDATSMDVGAMKPARVAVNDHTDGPTTDAPRELPLLVDFSPGPSPFAARVPRDPQRHPATRVEADQMIRDKLTNLRTALNIADVAQSAAKAKAAQAAKRLSAARDRLHSAQRAAKPLRAAVRAAEKKQADAIRAFEKYMRTGTSAETNSGQFPDREPELEKALLDRTREADAARIAAAKGELSFADVQAQYWVAKSARDAATNAARDAQEDLASAQKALADANKEMRLRSKPVSVLVSLQAQRIYVRQGFEPVLEAPIKVAPLPGPVGTHVFTAMRYGSDPDTFDWRLISAQIPSASETSPDDARNRNVRETDETPLSVRLANAALGAFTIPDDILATITERARPGSSLIVSDRKLPLSENGAGTEFIVLTK